jgi:hypothetical protein
MRDEMQQQAAPPYDSSHLTKVIHTSTVDSSALMQSGNNEVPLHLRYDVRCKLQQSPVQVGQRTVTRAAEARRGCSERENTIIFYTNKTPPNPDNNEYSRRSRGGRPRRVFGRPAHKPQCTHTQSTLPGYCITGLAQATRQRQGHNMARASRRLHLHFEPSRPGWDTTPISTTG